MGLFLCMYTISGSVHLAQVYGLGKAQKKIGAFGTEGMILSAKFTPPSKYTPGQVRKSLERDLAEFKRGYVDIY